MSEASNGNAAVWFVDRHPAEGRGDKVAFVEGERRTSYGELAASSARMAGLYARHGIRREARAAMIVLDVLEFPTIFWGSLKSGVVPVPLNTLLTAEQYRYMLADSRAEALFVSAPLLGALEPVLAGCPDLKRVFVVGGEAGGHTRFEAELAASAEAPPVVAGPDEVAFWLYSSGSTGAPKGVVHVHGSLKGTADTYAAQVLGIREDDVVYSAAKLFFAYGLGNSMTFPMAVGASTVLLPARPTPEAVFALMRAHEPTLFFAVPTLYAAMLAQMKDDTSPCGGRLRLCVSAGEALPREVGARWTRATGVEILDGVGSTEMLHIFLSNRPGEVVYGTQGVAVPGYEVRLVDEHGAAVHPGGVGEMLVRGETAANLYWNQRAKSRRTFEGEWTRTGDKYTRDAAGRYVIAGRTDDMFKVSGVWVSPFEVEAALIAHPAVLEAAVVPALDREGLAKPKAFIVLKDGAAPPDFEELKEHVKARIGMWKYPRWIAYVDDLPKTATGKIQRFKLREMTHAR